MRHDKKWQVKKEEKEKEITSRVSEFFGLQRDTPQPLANDQNDLDLDLLIRKHSLQPKGKEP